MNAILSDESKFTPVNRNNTKEFQAQVNQLINAANAVIGGVHFEPIIGDYTPGYAYGNVKTHKKGNPLRPIISQVPTPTYQLAKRLNHLITPYLPDKYCLKSTADFVDIIHSSKPAGVMASLDVESLFTNVPVNDTVEIILDCVYKHPTLPPLSLTPSLLKKMLLACTSEALFRSPTGQLFKQKDGVAMGSPLGCLFANMYMGWLEGQVLENIQPILPTYCRYVDDIFLQAESPEQLRLLKKKMEEMSVLKFTIEESENNRIAFLDLDIDSSHGTFKTTVYRKPTDAGRCMNGKSECPDRYRHSVIRAYVRRAIKCCNSWTALHQELQHVKQILVNNSFSNTEVDQEIQAQLDRHQHQTPPEQKPHAIKLFYKNQMSPSHKVDERVLQSIIHNNIIPTDDKASIDLVIYYKNTKTSSLFMKNNMSANPDPLQRTCVVYKFTCPHDDCRRHPKHYIGATTTTLSRRITMHRNAGGPHDHMEQDHGHSLTRQDLTNNISIIKSSTSHRRLWIYEALLTAKALPYINKQVKSWRTTELFGGAF